MDKNEKKKVINPMVERGIVTAVLIVIWPVGMYFLWKNKNFDKIFKWVQSVSSCVVWLVLICAIGSFMLKSGTQNNNSETMGSTSVINNNKEELTNTDSESSNKNNVYSVDSGTKEQRVPTTKPTSTPIVKDTSGAGAVESEKNTSENNSVISRNVSELTILDVSIIDSTINDMKQYDYIKDVAIEVDESSKDINIVVQVPSLVDEETAKMAGEDVARYLASCASSANNYYSTPGSTDIGGIYKTYNLLLYVDDGMKTFDMYGAKVKSASSITWR